MNRSPLLIHRWFPHPQNADWAYGPGLERADFERCVRAVGQEYKGPVGKVGPLIVPGEPPLVLVGERIDDRREVETRGKPMLRLAVLPGLPGWASSLAIAAGLEAKDVEGPGEDDSLYVDWEGDAAPVALPPEPEPEPAKPEPVAAESSPKARSPLLPALISGIACLVMGGLLGSALTGDPAPRAVTTGPAVDKSAAEPVKPTVIPKSDAAIEETKSKDAVEDVVKAADRPTPPVEPTPIPEPSPPAPAAVAAAPPTLNLADPAVLGVRSLAMVVRREDLLDIYRVHKVKDAGPDDELSRAFRKALDSVALFEIGGIKDQEPPLKPEDALTQLATLDGEFRKDFPTQSADSPLEVFAWAREDVALAALREELKQAPATALPRIVALRKRLGLAKDEPLDDLFARTRDEMALRKILEEAGRPPAEAIGGLRIFRKVLNQNGFASSDPISKLAFNEHIRAYLRAFERAQAAAIEKYYDRGSLEILKRLARDYYHQDVLTGPSNNLENYITGIEEMKGPDDLDQEVLLIFAAEEKSLIRRVQMSFPMVEPRTHLFTGTLLPRKQPGTVCASFKVPMSLIESSGLQLAIYFTKANQNDRSPEIVFRSGIERWPIGREEMTLKTTHPTDKEFSSNTVLLRRGAILPELPTSANLFDKVPKMTRPGPG